MLADGDQVMIAVSGGIDSLVLSWVLNHWRQKAPIQYNLLAVHIDNGFEPPEDSQPCAELVARQLEKLSIPFLIEKTDFGPRALAAEDGRSVCYHCAKQRRNRLFELAGEKNFNKIAFGHHKDDILETFFLNLLYSGNLSTMTPNQKLFNGAISIIRPLAFLEKEEIIAMGKTLDIEPVKNPCPHDDSSKRQTARRLVEDISAKDPSFKASIFTALGNIREGYLL
jgi:tRNA 2-thiocytidine biosynthesis protein TtcA